MTSLELAYRKEAEDCIQNILTALDVLGTTPASASALESLFRNAHTLKGIALQSGHYSTAYLARLIQDMAALLQKRGKPVPRKRLLFLKDFSRSLAQAFEAETLQKKAKLSRSLIQTMDGILEKEWRKP